jgi:putative ABC transport system permease protein
LKESYSIYGYFVAFALMVGLLAGMLPAAYLSTFNPVNVLKGTIETGKKSKLTLRKSLIVIQFTFALIFIMVVMVIYNQVDYMVTKDYGINDKNKININLQGVAYSDFANELTKVKGVLSVGGVSHPLGTWADRSSEYVKTPDGDKVTIRDFAVDQHYVENLGITFLAGKNFDLESESNNERHVILNEKALPLFGFSDPLMAIGQTIYSDSSTLMITGVVKDFHFRPLTYPIGPLAFRFQEQQLNYASVQITPDQKEAVEESIRSTWKAMASPYPLEMVMMDKEIDEAYAQSGFKDILVIVTYSGILTVIMACLGMLGMAMYATQLRYKEIGIRKVMGAESWQITILLSKLFFFLIGIAIVIGIPAGYLLSNILLENFAYKISISFGIILVTISFILLLASVIIGSQTIRAASLNPLKFLRHD